MTSRNLQFRRAELADIPAVVALVNSAYRGESSKEGWTTEADLLDGVRVDETDLRKILENPRRTEWIELACDGDSGELLGSVFYRQEDPETAYLGMISVRPRLQGAGIGSRLIDHFESQSKLNGSRRVRMTVISVREELIAYYERRGYRRTGASEPFPIGDGHAHSRYKQGPLTLVELEKTV